MKKSIEFNVDENVSFNIKFQNNQIKVEITTVEGQSIEEVEQITELPKKKFTKKSTLYMEKIYDFICLHPGVRTNQIVEGTKFSKYIVSNNIGRLSKLNKIKFIGPKSNGGYYSNDVKKPMNYVGPIEIYEKKIIDKNKILNYIIQNKKATRKEISNVLNIDSGKVYQYLRHLIDEKKIKAHNIVLSNKAHYTVKCYSPVTY